MPAPLERTATKIATRIITGLPGRQRASAIGAVLGPIPLGEKITVILEGAPAPSASVTSPIPQELNARPDMSIHVLAPGCMCCIGNLALRVTLARVLRLERPQHLILAMMDGTHSTGLTKLLSGHPYDTWLQLVEAREI